MNLKNVRFKRTDLWENVRFNRTDILSKTDGNDFSVEIFWNLQKLVSKNVRLWKRMVQINSMNI